MGIKVDIKRKLGEFSLDIHFQTESKRIGILGASGCGKSMTLKSIAGIETPDFGMIQIDDKVLFDSANKVDLKPQKRNVGYIVLRDRQYLSENGLIIIVLTLEKYTNQLLAGPDIVSRGFVYVRESEYLMDEAREVVYSALERCLDNHVTDWTKIKTEIKDSLSDYLWKKIF